MDSEPEHDRVRRWQQTNRRFSMAMVVLWAGVTLVHEGYRLRVFESQQVLRAALDTAVVASFVFRLLLGLLGNRPLQDRLHQFWREAAFLILAVILLLSVHAGTLAVAARLAPGGLRRIVATSWGKRYISALYRRPMLVLALSFAVTILVGTLFLSLPAATENGHAAPFLVALFTATSATCVTGLIVVDTPAFFSRFGETVILLLIEIGGLGIMTLSAALFVVMGRRLSARQRRMLSSVVDEMSLRDAASVVVNIVRTTLLVEVVGSTVLLLVWWRSFPNLPEAIYSSVFHAISAFCNAGFSLFSDNLSRFASNPWVNLLFATLVVLGGLGFGVVMEIFSLRPLLESPARRLRRMQMHTKVVLATSGMLVLFGALILFFSEFDHSAEGLPVPSKLLAATFHSISARTAGFNTLDLALLSPVGVLGLVFLMFIGGSPGGTAGGIKTTSFAALLLTVRAMLLGREDIEVFGRTISKENFYRAMAVGTVSFGLVAIGFTLLVATQDLPFMQLLFECVSAFGTVGLSMGVTAQLDAVGQVLIIVLMFAGRVGPLSLALVAAEERERSNYRYPEAKLLVG